MWLPERFIALMQEQLGQVEAGMLCNALGEEPSTSIRLNPWKYSNPKWKSAPVAWSSCGYTLESRPQFTLDSDFHAGAYYVQEASSQFAGYIMQAVLGGEEACRGLRVLDLCAAPGGKTTHYASLVGPDGMVVANEINHNRASVLADNARKWGLGNIVVTCNDSKRFTQLQELFDVVAVDAPCSGEGMFRKSEEAVEQWSEANVAMCAERQWEILQNAFEALAPGGVLIYSTCTFNATEDEAVVRRVCEQYGDELVKASDVFVDERWRVVVGRQGVFQTFRFFPHRVKGEGMFMAVARKAGESKPRRVSKSKRSPIVAVDKNSIVELRRWVQGAEHSFFVAGDTIYACRSTHYDDIVALSGWLSVIYSGVAMGQIFKGKLKPDGALAFYIGLNQQALPVREVPEKSVADFLRRQDISAQLFEEGVNLVTHNALPLGFVKRIGMRVNNLYPQSLRILKREN